MASVVTPIFVTWTQRWETEQYIEHYLRIRGLAGRPGIRERIVSVLSVYPGSSPYTKSDLDFYLDSNLRRGE